MLTLDIKFEYRKLRRCLIFYLIFMTLLEIILMYLMVFFQKLYGKRNGILTQAFIFVGVNNLTMFMSQIILLILAIRQRFGALNFFLQSTFKLKVQQLRTISRIHLKLTDAIEIMNGSYCVMAMIFLAGAFCMFNFFLFSLKSELMLFNVDRLIIFSSRVFLNFYSFVLTMSVIIVSCLTTKEIKRTVKILFDAMQQSNDSETNGLIASLVHQISFSPMKFTCGLFVFDWKLWFKVSYRFNVNVRIQLN